MSRRLAVCAVAALLALTGTAAAQAPVGFSVFAQTGLRLGDVLWSGRQLLYLEEWTGKIVASDAAGRNLGPFLTIEQNGEEMRCVPSSGLYWPRGEVFCHTPDNRILRIAGNGSSVTQLARLPDTANSDGTLAFDTVGRFGFDLLAATGGSGSPGGSVYVVHRDGRVDLVGAYPGPGGADEIVVAPRRFGTAGGALLLAIDNDPGRVLAVDPSGAVTVIASGIGNGFNPIEVISAPPKRRLPGSPAPGLYVTDTLTGNVYLAPARELVALRGAVVVGTELTGEFWSIRASGTRFVVDPLPTTLRSGSWNLEGALYVP